MGFLTTARLLMDLQARFPALRYEFNDLNGTVEISLPVEQDVPNLFHDAARMFEPA